MATRQILVLKFEVRILAAQQRGNSPYLVIRAFEQHRTPIVKDEDGERACPSHSAAERSDSNKAKAQSPAIVGIRTVDRAVRCSSAKAVTRVRLPCRPLLNNAFMNNMNLIFNNAIFEGLCYAITNPMYVLK